jgi:hypothetical protein
VKRSLKPIAAAFVVRIQSIQREIDQVRAASNRSYVNAGTAVRFRLSRSSATRTRARRRCSIGLTNETAVASNALFVTLDTAVRQVRLPDRRELLVRTRWVHRSPAHALVAASVPPSKSRGSGSRAPCHRCANPERERQVAAVRRVLDDVGAKDVRRSTSTTRLMGSPRTKTAATARCGPRVRSSPPDRCRRRRVVC